MPTPISVRLSRAALFVLLAGFAGCKMFHHDDDDRSVGPGTQPATQPDTRPTSRWPHGGVMANDTNVAYHAINCGGFLGSIERLDPKLDALVPPDAIMQKLVEGL